jgi:endonuclease-3
VKANDARNDPAPKTTAAKQAAAKKVGAKKAAAKKVTAKTVAAKKAAAKKVAPKNAAPRKIAAKKVTTKNAVRTRRPRGRESRAARAQRVEEILRRLHAEYPDAKCSLDFVNPYQLLVATILSAQCTDERVNMVTPALFRRFPGPEDLAGARPEELEELIRSTGFFRNKTRSLLGMANAVVERHGGRVPETMDALVKLPGVGRKTANVVLGNAFDRDEGIVVDTHVTRLSSRLGLTRAQDAVRIEHELMPIVPRSEWTDVSHLFIYHGRAVCRAPTPRCEVCVINDLCPSSRV